MAKKPHPKITQKHIDNANEIAQLLSAMKGGEEQEGEQPTTPPPPVGVSPLGGQAK